MRFLISNFEVSRSGVGHPANPARVMHSNEQKGVLFMNGNANDRGDEQQIRPEVIAAIEEVLLYFHQLDKNSIARFYATYGNIPP